MVDGRQLVGHRSTLGELCQTGADLAFAQYEFFARANIPLLTILLAMENGKLSVSEAKRTPPQDDVWTAASDTPRPSPAAIHWKRPLRTAT